MKLTRTKNTINGFAWGAAGKIVNIIIPFVIRTVMIYKLGVEYLGLSSLFASILQVLSLSELGFGYACVFAMYKPIAEDKYEVVGSILQYLKKIYNIIGCVLLGIGLLFLPFIKLAIRGDVPADINIYILYLIYLCNSAMSYFFFAYKSTLLSALQCNATINKVGLLTNTILRLGQCLILFIIPDYYAYVIFIPLSTLANNVIKAVIVNKKYSKYLIDGEIQDEIKTDIKKHIFPLIGTKISVVLINAADTLVISAFLGLTETALYNNYFFVMSAIQSIVYEIHSSMLAGIGNSLVMDSRQEALRKFTIFNFVNSWLVTFCTVCFVCLYQPFIFLWVGTENMLPFGMAILFSAYFYVTTIERIVMVYKDASGIWKADILRSYASCAINIVLNVLSVQYIGLYGVIGSSVLVGALIDPWMAKTVYRLIFHESPRSFYFHFAKDAAICALICGLFFVICNNLAYSWVGLLIRGSLCCIGVNALMLLLYRSDSRYTAAQKWVMGVVKRSAKK